MSKEELDAAIGTLEAWGRAVDNWVLICAAGVAIFLAAEVVFSVIHWQNENSLRPLRAEQNRLHAVELATLGKETEVLKSENLKLEAIIAPRSLTVEQQRALASALKPFAGMRAVISSPPMDGEALGLAQQILASLSAAGINPVDMSGKLGHVAGFAFGIHMVGRNGNKRNEALFKELYAALESFGQSVDAVKGNAAAPLLTYPGDDFPEAKTSAVAIFVGTKPVPIMKK